MFLQQSKHQHGANRGTGLFSPTKYSLISICGTFKNLFRNEYSQPLGAFGRPKFWQNEGDGGLILRHPHR